MEIPGVTFVPVSGGSPLRELRRKLSHLRVGMTPVLFDGDGRYRALRWAAFRLAPAKILAYNKDLQEDKEALFDTVKTVQGCLEAMTILFSEGLSFRTARYSRIRSLTFSSP